MVGKMAELAAPWAHPSTEMAKNQAYVEWRKRQLWNGRKLLWHFYRPFLHPLPISVVVLRRVAYVQCWALVLALEGEEEIFFYVCSILSVVFVSPKSEHLHGRNAKDIPWKCCKVDKKHPVTRDKGLWLRHTTEHWKPGRKGLRESLGNKGIPK